MTPLLVTWLPRQRIILSAINTSGLTCTNKWTYTVLFAWFVKELEWSVGSNQGNFSLFLFSRWDEMLFLWTLLPGYQKVSHMGVRMTQSLWLLTNSPKCVTTSSANQTWQQKNYQKSSSEMSYDCIEYLQQLYLIVDRFSTPGYRQTSCTSSELSDNLVQRFTNKQTDRQREKIAFLNNIYAVMSTTCRMTVRPF